MAKSPNSFIMRVVKGFIIGVAGILPGASGGVLAVSMGIYRPVIDAVISIFKNFKVSFMYLLPLGIGGVIGLLSMSRAVEWLIVNWQVPVMYTLIGMVLGGVPSFIKEANAHGFKKRYLFGTVVGVILIALFALLEQFLSNGTAWPINGWSAAASGAILAVGTIIPGISTSFLLMYLGLFEPMLSAFNTFNIPLLFCMGLGFVAMAALLVIFVKKMFDKHYGYSYYAVFGFLMGSIVLIFPGFELSIKQLIYIALLAAGFISTYMICRFTDPNSPKPNNDVKNVE